MRAKDLVASSAILLAAVTAVIAAGQASSPNSPSVSSAPAPQQSPEPPPPQQAAPSGFALRVQTRLVTVDIVATDAHGNVVRDLKPEEFEVSDGGRQKIAQFAFIDKSVSAAAASVSNGAQSRPKGFYSNRAEFENLRLPPTVVLMDALNTEGANLMQARHDMLRMLRTLPPNTPVAVFLLEQSLAVVQDFTSDPTLLRDALDKTTSPGKVFAKATRSLEGFEKENYERTMDIRVATTLDALTALAHYLGGYRGRKNLIWVSASFPVALLPDQDFGTDMNASGGTHVSGGKVQDTANALTDAQVAVYPVDARGLESETAFSAAENPQLRPDTSPSRAFSAQLDREKSERMMTQNAMDLLARGTGGKTCKNTNNLSGCVEAALMDSSSYYELAYNPQNVKWDGSFHGISVDTTRPGVKLAYRRGYFARDAENLVKDQSTEKRLQQTCMDLLPSTAIPITAQAVRPTKPDGIRYLMSVDPSALNFATDGQLHKLSAEMATCVYRANNSSFQFFPRDLTQSFSDAAYQGLQASGLSGYLEVPKAGTRRVRIAVLNIETGLTGALDIPVRPEDFENAAAPPAMAAILPAISVLRKGKENAPALHWDPPQVDALVPSLSEALPCALPNVLKQAGVRAQGLFDHLQNFDAHEQIRYEQNDSVGTPEMYWAANFDYSVDLGEQSGHRLRETRTLLAGSYDSRLSAIVDAGLPALALIFYPALQGDYEMHCKGLGQWNGQLAWVVYFQQIKGKRPRTVSMATARKVYPVSLKGRAWIAADSGEVVHLETNLMSGIAELELQTSAASVDYAPVTFQSQNVQIWLPQSALVYTEYFTNSTIIQHTFSDFRLFSVQTQQVNQKPK
jgi:VWFA-related protein